MCSRKCIPAGGDNVAGQDDKDDVNTGQDFTKPLTRIDGRAGRKSSGRSDKFKKWRDIKEAFDYWALRTRTSLAVLRQDMGTG